MPGMDYHLVELELKYFVLKLKDRINVMHLRDLLEAHIKKERPDEISGEQLAKLIIDCRIEV